MALLTTSANRMGENLQFVRAEFADLLPGLRNGNWDVSAAMFLTPTRAAQAFFTRPVWRLGDGLLVRRDQASEVKGYGSLCEQRLSVAVLEGQIQHQTALACGIDPARILVFADCASAADAVLGGRVDAYASVLLAHRETLLRHPILAAIAVPQSERPSSHGVFACATEKLRHRLDSALEEILATPEYRVILRRYGLGLDEEP